MAEHLRRGAAALLAVLALTACAGPTIRDEAIRGQAQKSTESMVSEVETVLLATRGQLEGKSWWRYTDVVVTDAETAAGSIESTFSSRQPPSKRSQPLYEKTSTALSDAADLITSMRVALRHRDVAEMQSLRPKLQKASAQLSKLEEQTR